MKENISFEPVNYNNPNHALFLYNCLKMRMEEPDTNISHTVMPTYDEHLQFLRNCPYQVYQILHYNGSVAGYVYITNQQEIGIYVQKEFRGMGIGGAVIKLMAETFPGLKANINPRNKRSKKLFRGLGFKLIQETYIYGK